MDKIDIDIREWLDSNNRCLLEEIEKVIPVKFTLWGEESYACQVHQNCTGEDIEAEVFYKEPLSQPKFAHELLHVKTTIVLGNNRIMFSIDNQTIPFKTIMNSNAQDISNVCEHIIFYPDYLDFGYDEDSFEQPTDLDDRRDELSSLAREGLKTNGHYSPKKVSVYLSLIFTFLFYPIEDRFRNEVKVLRKIDFPLFSRINKLKIACTDLDIVSENREYIQDAYYEFAKDINEWFSKAFQGLVFKE